MSVESILNTILIEEGKETFYSIENSDGKRWIIPQQNIHTALSIYQPGGFKGKLFKRFFPYVCHLKFVYNILRIDRYNYSLSNELKQKIREIFGVDNIEFSIFCGTPSVHRKITVQFFCRDRIMGYCKISTNKSVSDIFRHEQYILNTLASSGVQRIPHCMACETLSMPIDILVMNTCKSNRSIISHNWTQKHWDFLEMLSLHTSHNISFEQTDFCKTLDNLEIHLDLLPHGYSEILRYAITSVRREYSGREVRFSAFHGDFTPWNSYIEGDKLYAFDFEYASLSFPPYLDWFHFFTQTMILEQHQDVQYIVARYRMESKLLTHFFDNPDFAYRCYLLSAIGTYSLHDADTETIFRMWGEILRYILPKFISTEG